MSGHAGLIGLGYEREPLMVDEHAVSEASGANDASAQDDAAAQDVANGLCAPFIEALPVTGASISVFSESGLQSTICASDSVAARVEELQFDLGEGPHWEALRTGKAVLVADLHAVDHADWPIFAAAVRETTARAFFSFPLALGAVTVGVADLYRIVPGGLSTSSIAAAQSIANRIAVRAVRQALRSTGENATTEESTAPAVRREVHQATGMILVQLDTTATAAFLRLRGVAFSTGRTVQEVAHDVVIRELDFRSLPGE